MAMPEGGIQVTSHQSLIPSHSSLLSNFRVSPVGVLALDCVRKKFSGFSGFCGFKGFKGVGAKNDEAPRHFDSASRRRHFERSPQSLLQNAHRLM